MAAASAASVLLALAKDVRYVDEAIKLIGEVRQAMNFSVTSAGNRRAETDCWHASNATVAWAAYLLIAIATVSKNGGISTLGMQAVGIEYKNTKTGSDKNVRIHILAATAVALMAMAAATVLSSSPSSSPDREGLRGNSRRQEFEQQRKRMMDRATSNALNGNNEPTAPGTGNRRKAILAEIPSRLGSTVLPILRSLLGWDLPGSPHELPENNNDEDVTVRRRNNAVGLVKWILQLHLGWYCYQSAKATESGQQAEALYPTLWHRLLRLELTPSPNTASEDNHDEGAPGTSQLVNTPNNTKVIGLLILLHSAGVGIHTVSRMLVRRYVKWRLHSESASQASRTSGSITFEQPRPTETVSNHISSPGNNNAITCGICQQPRVHPACSIKCGHVLCWSCWQGWLLDNTSCPICRVDCAPPDILALYQYQPSYAPTLAS